MALSWVGAINGLVLASFLMAPQAKAEVKKCLHVASYGNDFDWTNGIQQGLSEKLKGICDVDVFYMDTKRNPGDEFAKKKGVEARDLIEKTKPDLVLTSDDNAVKWLLIPYYKDAKLPFVFTGVNWSIEPYKLPYKNTTGVIEVAPIEPLVYEIKKNLKDVKTIAFLTIETETERKEFPFVNKRLTAAGYAVKEYWAKNMADWKKLYNQAQNETDFVYFSNKVGANDWKEDDAAKWVKQNQKRPSAGTYEWMTPYVAFVMAKSPLEQAELGAEQAKQILGGKDPSTVLVTANKLYDAFVNKDLLEKSGMKLSEGFMRRAKVVSK